MFNGKLSLVGLGYVGLPIAVAFSKKLDVIGFDVNDEKIALYRQGIDPTREVGSLAGCKVDFTSDPARLRECAFHIIAVPTPIRGDKMPDLTPVKSASKILGQNLVKGSIVVYESTVYPGVTEDICVPILEKESGLVCGKDFKVGYSPERINPGDKIHRLETIVKIVSGMDEESLDTIASMYELVVEAGVHRAESIKVAEAAKVIENCQRDINIAFVNELSLIFGKMGLDTQAVLKAAGTKWNFLNFTPGLVGGHCIGVDPYYLTYAAEQQGYHSQVILSGRRINDDMGRYVAEMTVKRLFKNAKIDGSAKVLVFGLTFKSNCPDTRNTRVIDILRELAEYGIETAVIDPIADKNEVMREYGTVLQTMEDAKNADAVIVAVDHEEFKSITPEQWKSFYRNESPHVFMDVKGMYDKKEMKASGFLYWRL